MAIVALESATLNGVSTEMAYAVGILHDIGRLRVHIRDEEACKDAYAQSGIDGKLLEREVDSVGKSIRTDPRQEPEPCELVVSPPPPSGVN